MNDREKDDQILGRVLTRREIFSLLSVAGAGMVGAAAMSPSNENPLPGCIGRPEQTEGPYFLDTKLNRSDIRSDSANGAISEGIPLQMTFKVFHISGGTCVPLPGAVVHLWHCDAKGAYSGVRDPYFNTEGKTFLRGYQVTDDSGIVHFRTVYPGWYPGRTVHLHFKIRKHAYEFTSQLYFNDALTDEVFRRPPYAERGRRMVRNAEDGLFRSGGEQLMLDLKKDGPGYSCTFDIGLQGIA